MGSHIHVFEQAIGEASQVPQSLPRQPATCHAARQKPTRRARKASVPFIRGPIPLKWLVTASALSRSAARLSIALWYRLGVQGQHVDLTGSQDVQLVVRIDRQLRTECGLERWHVSEGIRDLFNCGLIRPLKAGRGRCPVVQVVALGTPGDNLDGHHGSSPPEA
jgi:hypothetical protein